MQISPGTNINILKEFEDLGALSSNGGLIKIKPFRDWVQSSWAKKIFELRLCNTGEIIDIYKELDTVPVYARELSSKIEFIIRSIYSIDTRIFSPEDEVQKYNEMNNTNLTRIEYLRAWIKNVEGVVINRMYAIYELLEVKQIRLLSNQVLCEITGKTFPKEEIPEGSILINNCLGEIITKEGLEMEGINIEVYEEDMIIIKDKSEKLKENLYKDKEQMDDKESL
jgi:hypothetical protein